MEPFSHKKEHMDEKMLKIEVNLDDIPGEWLGHVMDLLFDAGVNDVFYIPIYMKKNRPGVMLQILCNKEKLDKVSAILFQETTTLGIRYFPITVHRLERRFLSVSTKWGEVTVKEGLYQGELIQRSPEYEDCRKIAELQNIPLKAVYQEVWRNI
ncbi:nickel insertion protein [Thalassobacillus pellis]|uniref:nickel insertion protein n=1 Tax=Thalassobacillus pellis TaxID=748008 RepID=UPI00195F8BB6|nr:nickel insertion protein [Thalassobacillus pellis]MBM7551616.1 uncharacterized protein (DUF111 family) [Thalassobacillus pellis]